MIKCLSLVILVIVLILLVGCTSPFEPATEESLTSAISSGDFYTEWVSDTLVYIHLEGTHSPSLSMMYVTEQLELIDSQKVILSVNLAIYRQWIWSPVIVVLGGRK